MGRVLVKLRRILLHHVLHADDTPHAIALGVALATVVAFLPLVGFQTAIAIGLAVLFRANKAVCIPIVWITNPFTLVPIYGGCLALGRFVMSLPATNGGHGALVALDQSPVAADFVEVAFWKDLFHRLAGLGVELWIGSAIVGVVFGIASYFLARWGVVAYRERRRRKILRRNLFRSRSARGNPTRRSEPV